ncbi:hypothetical protein [Actinomadura opuntiae]|uniref:hypothetical protein n=1 Tax=Actinomadura sp. OS1-43 TaxID=604315 RepID=UPI00255AE9EC|nr:hypothetical protein [Actinomadura sp. OS1-43]MDL4812786.1 hypothetical protein [Actinomadura sp. OS1-43]
MTTPTFDLDEALFPAAHVLPGLLSRERITHLEQAWKAAKIDEWCAVSRLTGAADTVRRAAGLTPEAPMGYALPRAEDKARGGDQRAARAVADYAAAAAAYEEVRVELEELRQAARG